MRCAKWWGLLVVASVLQALASTQVLALEKPDVVRNQVYVERESGPLLADSWVPKDDGPFPAVLVIHGGSWSSGDKGQLAFIANRLAMLGYTTVAINYRLAPTHKYPCQVDDCKAAVRWMRAHAKELKLDPDRIGCWGYSAGGHLASMLGATDDTWGLADPTAKSEEPSCRVKCVVAGGTPSDFRLLEAESDRLSYWLGGTRKEKADIYTQASPNFHVTSDDCPMYFYHGDADELVPLISSQAIHESCKKAGVESQLFVIPKGKHIGAALDAKAINEGIKFLDHHLKPSVN